MVKISSARIDVENGRVDNALFKSYGEVMIGGATGVSASGAYTCDLSQGDVFNLILDTATCQLYFTNATAGGTTSCSFTLILRQSIGAGTVAWPSHIIWDNSTIPQPTATPGRMDVFYFITHDAGRKWFGFVAQQNITQLNAGNTKLWGWGTNSSGQLGLCDAALRLIPSPINENTLLSIGSAANTIFFVDSSNKLWGSGANNPPLLDGTLALRSSPIQVGALTDWLKINASNNAVHVIKTDGTLWGWGGNATGSSTGIVGNNTVVTTISSPTQVGTNTNWTSIGGISYNKMAINTSGQLFTWGVGGFGAIGDNAAINRSSPVQVGTLTDWAVPCTGFSGGTMGAVKTDGTLWMWGLGSLGPIGDNTIVSKSSPVQIGTLTNWASITTGTSVTLAVKTDGTAWAWGNNTVGQLAQNSLSPTSVSSPVQIGTLTNWSAASAAASHVIALKTDGTVWVWGYNNQGLLGLNNDTANRSSPVQIGNGTTWTKVQATGLGAIIYKP